MAGKLVELFGTATLKGLRNAAMCPRSPTGTQFIKQCVTHNGVNERERVDPQLGHYATARNILKQIEYIVAIAAGDHGEEVDIECRPDDRSQREHLVSIWTEPRHIDTLEWFASSEDLCRVLATLGERARTKPQTAPVLDVLAKNPGLPVDAAVWPYVGFKGGSEPGVMNLSWLLRRKDDRWFVVTLGVNDTKRELDEGKILGVATGMPIVAVYDAASQGLLGGFSAYPGQTAGVRVATVDRDGDGRADILTSFNAPIPIVAVYGGLSFSLMDGFFAQTPGIADSPNGIYVG